MITHYDLFAGIGGFSLALEEVFTDETIRHIFCEWEQFPTAVLKQHWPDGEYWGDIADLVAHTKKPGLEGRRSVQEPPGRPGSPYSFRIVTGGFPCQPFSAAGKRKGTDDHRYKWPEMFRVVQLTRPQWVIAENVRGLTNWSDGMVLEQVCADLESEGYEVQPFIIPAVAVGAPHRRDRVWIIAHRSNERRDDRGYNRQERQVLPDTQRDASQSESERQGRVSGAGSISEAPADTRPQRRQQGVSEGVRPEGQESKRPDREYPDWSRDWREVAFATCNDAMDDGLPRLVDGVSYSRAKWRKDSLRAYGNAIVPQVAIEIFKAIKATNNKGE